MLIAIFLAEDIVAFRTFELAHRVSGCLQFLRLAVFLIQRSLFGWIDVDFVQVPGDVLQGEQTLVHHPVPEDRNICEQVHAEISVR